MRIQKIGHSCLLLELDGARVLVDPGNLVTGWTELTDLTAVLVTHQHPDHLDLANLPRLLDANPGVRLVADEGSARDLRAGDLAERDLTVTVAHGGDTVDLDGIPVRVVGETHAVIHPDVPMVPNVGYVVGDLFHPGDHFTPPPADAGVRILAAPVAAPWSKLAETVDYLRGVGSLTVVPVHDEIIAAKARPIFTRNITALVPDVTLRSLDEDRPVEV